MSSPIIFGRIDRFAIEVESINERRELGDIHIRICGERVGDGIRVFVPTFTAQLRSFAKMHLLPPFEVKDFSGISDEDTFNLLYAIVTTGTTLNDIPERVAVGYHLMHSLDCAVDGWTIFVVDDGKIKRIIWKGTGNVSPPPHHRDRVWSTTLPAVEFVTVIMDYVDFVKSAQMG